MNRMPKVWQEFLEEEFEKIMLDPFAEFSKRQYLTRSEKRHRVTEPDPEYSDIMDKLKKQVQPEEEPPKKKQKSQIILE